MRLPALAPALLAPLAMPVAASSDSETIACTEHASDQPCCAAPARHRRSATLSGQFDQTKVQQEKEFAG